MDKMISVIIPCFNAAKTIERCIDSLRRQSYENIQIIAVNDGSTDETQVLLEKISKEEKRLILINQKNSGVSATRNIGMKKANGEYYSFVDADDFVDSDFLLKLITFIDGNDISICCYTDNFNEIKITHNFMTVNEIFREMMVPQVNIAAFVWNRLYKASIIRSHNLYFAENVRVCEDTLFNYQYMQYVKKAAICWESLYHYMINGSSMMFGKYFDRNKISANIAFEYMLNHSEGKPYHSSVEIAAMWFNLILKRQIYNSNYIPSNEEIETINQMLSLNNRAFLSAPIPIKYKLAYPFWRIR